MSSYVGIDIGASAVRVAQVSDLDDNHYVTVEKAGMHRLPDGVVVAGVIRDAPSAARAIQEALRKAKISPKAPAIVGITNRHTAVGLVDLPGEIGPQERTGALRHGRKEISPAVELARSNVSWNLKGSQRTGEGRPLDTLVVAAALEDELASVKSVAKLAKLNLRAVDLSAAALARALVRTTPHGQEVTTLVDVGASKTVVATREGPHLRNLRVVPTGGSDITFALVDALGDVEDAFTEAERRKMLLRLPSAPRQQQVRAASDFLADDVADMDTDEEADHQTLLEEALDSSARTLIAQIVDSVSSDANAYPHRRSQAIVLAGGGAQLRGLKEALELQVGLPTITTRPWAHLARSKTTESLFVERPDVDVDELLLPLATAIGLSMWKEPA